MAVLTPLRVFIETHENGNHFIKAGDLIAHSSRLLSFTFVTPKLGRYTVPALCGFGDVALWISASGDAPSMIDVSKLWKQARVGELCAVYVPKDEHDNPCPSMMLFRNKYCEKLTPDYVFNAKPGDLIPSVWAGGLGNIGTLEV